ncbi:hypothetical protein KTD26_34710, partial [Burkholderia multivorans]|uniref:hypothetical protein n=1 Tax=Burkholderia multivorans TaxID=87883 RepID=UPI001C216230
ASCGGSPWFPVREVGPGNPILSDSTGEPPPSTFNYAWDIADEGHSKAVQGKQGCSVIDLARLIFRQETNGPPTTKYFPASLEPLLEAL